MKRLLILLIFFFLLYGLSSHNTLQGSVEYSYSISGEDNIRIGDIVSVNFSMVIEEEFLYSISGSDELASEDYYIAGEEKEIVTAEKDGSIKRVSKSFSIMPKKEGNIIIPPLKIEYWREGEPEKKSFLLTNPIDMNVISNLSGDDNIPRDIKGPFILKKSYMAHIIVFFLFLTAVSIILYLYYKRRMNIPEKPAEVIPPENIARRKLAELIESELLEKGSLKLFLFRLTQIIKEYIQGAYFFNATDMTTSELGISLRQADIEEKLYESIMQYFIECDLYKFSDIGIEVQKAKELYDRGYDLVERDSSGRKAKIVYSSTGEAD